MNEEEIKKQIVISLLKPYDEVEITIKDMPNVRPQSRGKTIRCVFKGLENTEEGTIVWCEGNRKALDILEHDITQDPTMMGFHTWLIEDLKILD